MKYKSKQYAKALADIMVGSKTDVKKVTERFLELLEKNGDIGKAKEIMTLAEDIFIKKTGRRKIILETARPMGKNQIVKSFEMAGDIIEQRVNPEIIAGIKITINDEQLDMSIQKKLQEIF